MHFAKSLVVLSLLSGISPSIAQDLISTLQKIGANNFAKQIQSDQSLHDLFYSSDVGTVFAPYDSTAGPPPSAVSSRKRQGSGHGAYGQSAGLGIQKYADLNKPPVGAPIPISNPQAGGKPNNVVSDTRNNTGSSKRRWIHSRQANASLPSLLRITAGLGQNANLLKSDIPYSGGVIHLVDSYFTLPESVSNTAQATGLKTFSALMTSSSNMSSMIDNTPLTTIFLPTDAAFAAANITASSASASLLTGLIVPNFLGYLPNLQNGLQLTTQSGTVLTVTIKGSDYYINGAKITTSNVITTNGVAHIIDQVIQPSPPKVVSSGVSLVNHLSMGAVAAACGVVAMFVFGTA